MWKLAIEDDQGHRTVVNLVRDEYTVGRAQENTVRLTERNISRHHAVLRRNGAGWVVELAAHRELTVRFPDGSIHNTGPPSRRAT